MAFLTLQATAIGVAVRQMEGFDQIAGRAAVGVPAGFDPVVVIAPSGYAGDPEALADEPNTAPRSVSRGRAGRVR